MLRPSLLPVRPDPSRRRGPQLGGPHAFDEGHQRQHLWHDRDRVGLDRDDHRLGGDGVVFALAMGIQLAPPLGVKMSLLPVLFLVLILPAAFCADPTVTTATIAQVEVVTVAMPAAWASSIVRSADRDAFLAKPNVVLINGGSFNAAKEPDALVIIGGTTWGKLRDDAPYSGFAWADSAGKIHIERRAKPPDAPAWAIQSGPLLVESGKSGINSSLNVAPRSVLALKGGVLLVVRTGSIGLKELAEWLMAAGVEVAINLDGGPSADLRVRVGGVATDRPGKAQTPYGIGFSFSQ